MNAEAAVVLLAQPRLLGLKPRLEALGWRVAFAWALDAADRRRVRAIINVGEAALGPELLGSLPRLGLIANVGTGYDGVDVDWCRAHGIEVTHAKSLNAADVADHAMGLLLGSWRHIFAGDRQVREGGWTFSDGRAVPPSLTGRAIGIVGLGAIGTAIAERATAFGLEVQWWGPRARESLWPRASSLMALAEASDIFVIACRADRSNPGLISAEVISAVGRAGLLINIARGSLIDEAALIAALKEGRLGAAALDVFEQEPTPAKRWGDVPNVLLTPHTAGATKEAIHGLLDQAYENVRRYLAGEPVLSPV